MKCSEATGMRLGCYHSKASAPREKAADPKSGNKRASNDWNLTTLECRVVIAQISAPYRPQFG